MATKDAVQLRQEVIDARAGLERADAEHRAATTAFEWAKNLANVTERQRCKAILDDVTRQVTEAAIALESALAAFQAEHDREYHDSLFAATTESRALTAQRPGLQKALADLEKNIQAAEAREQPAVAVLVERQRNYSAFGQDVNRYKLDIVRRVDLIVASV